MARKKAKTAQADMNEENFDGVAPEALDLPEPDIANEANTLDEETGKYQIGTVIVDTGTAGDEYEADGAVNINDYEEIDESKEGKDSKLFTASPDDALNPGAETEDDPWIEAMNFDPDNPGLEED